MSWRNDPAQRKAYYAAWYQKNRHTVAKRSAKWWDAHPGASKVYNAKYRSAHPDRRRTSQAKWRVAHPEACYQHAQNHVHRRLSNGGSHTLSQWHALLEAHDYKCFYHKDLYGSELILTKKTATRDHVVPVSKGGANDISNIVPACRACNSKKHDRRYPTINGRPVKAFQENHRR